MDTQEAIESRKAQNAKHNPWDRLSQAAREAQLSLQGCRPIKWTLDLTLHNTVDEDGYLHVYAGGPVEGTAKVKTRADGEVDGRSKGVRKCGRCGETGHNARTCRGTPKTAPVSTPSGVAPFALAPKVPVVPVETRPAVRENAPAPRLMVERPVVRAAIKVPGKKTCGKCGQVGHNARTCGKGEGDLKAKVKHSKAPGKTGRQNTCGKCGGKGHNARTCKG